MSQVEINSFFNMKVGDIKQTQAGNYSDFSSYKRLSDTTVAGLQGATIENNKVLEGGNGLVDRRVFIRKSGYTYMLGTYYQTPNDLNNFYTFISSFQFVNNIR